MHPIQIKLAVALKKARKASGLSCAQVGEQLDLTRASISNIEAGRQAVNVITFINFCRAVNVSPSDLISEIAEGGRLEALEAKFSFLEEVWCERFGENLF